MTRDIKVDFAPRVTIGSDGMWRGGLAVSTHIWPHRDGAGSSHRRNAWTFRELRWRGVVGRVLRHSRGSVRSSHA